MKQAARFGAAQGITDQQTFLVDLSADSISFSNTHAMTNKEIMQSDLLDILFEHRNKAYGAYALRRNYNHRLLSALGSAMSVIVLLLLINSFAGNNNASSTPVDNDNRVVLKTIEMPPEKIKETEKPKTPERPKEKSKAIQQAATIKHVDIVIKPNDQVPVTEVPDKTAIENNDIDKENKPGKEPDGKVKAPTPDETTGNGEFKETNDNHSFIPDQREPEFPGGVEALHKFLSRHLSTPDELNSGEKRQVRIRFRVGADGSISTLEIEQSGGDIFDKEVIRVCKKMPRWKPAVQNGIHVPVSYLLPVTFIRSEQ